MINKLSLKTKLLTLCATMIFFTLFVGGISYWGVSKLDDNLTQLSKASFPNIKQADNMYLYYSRIRISLRTLGLPGITKQQSDEAVSNVFEMIKKYEAEDKLYTSRPWLSGEKELYDAVSKKWVQFKAIGVKVLELQKSGTPSDKEKMIQIFFNDCPKAAEDYDKAILNLVEYHNKYANELISTSDSDADLIRLLQNIIMAVSAIAGLGVGYYFATSISTMLTDISKSLSSGSDNISSLTLEISSASESLSSSITQQASALQETTSAVEETSASIGSNAENARKSAEISGNSKESAYSGKTAVDQVTESIDEISHSTQKIKDEIDQSNKEIAEIVNIINEIGSKTKIINEIVFQTKLLSFNASVEAARAGEHGRGFSVVAEEVGKLAQMSGNSAKEITELLESSIIKVEATIKNSQDRINKLMDISKEKVSLGTSTARKCSDALDDIISNVNNVDTMISEISLASSEQSQSVREITKAMNEIDSASHLNSASSQQVTVAAGNLESQVEDFRGLVIKLNALVTGQKKVA